MRYTGGRDRYVHCSKKGHFIEVSQVLSLIVVDHFIESITTPIQFLVFKLVIHYLVPGIIWKVIVADRVSQKKLAQHF